MEIILLGFGLIALLISIFVFPCYAGFKAQLGGLPVWVPAMVVAMIVLAFLLVPFDSQAAVKVFAAAGR